MKKLLKRFTVYSLSAFLLCFGTVCVKAESETNCELEGEAETSEKALQDALKSLGDKMKEKQNMKYYNLMLIGVDRLDDSWNGNSDVMILITVNREKQKIIMTSFLRDLYADIPGVGVRKLNAACANGGANLCVETIKQNYGVDIDNYAMVDFYTMINLVDVLGGIDLEITEEEYPVCNSYIQTMCEANGEDPEQHYFSEGGMQHLDGYRTVAYCRNRFSGNTNDFGRTDRQRNVLSAIFDKMKNSTEAQALSETLVEIAPYVSHNLDLTTITMVLGQMTDWMSYDLEQQRVPYDDMFYSENEILIPTDMEQTKEKLHQVLYD